MIDVATRCILGYSVSQEFNYNQYDIMDAIKDAIVPKELKDLSITEIPYPANGGFYSTAFTNLRYVLFDSIMLDNAKSHLSSFTLEKLVDGLQCTVNYGSVATPETRGIIAGMPPCISDEETVSEIINSLNLRVAERTVRGHVKKGKRPYVQFLGCEYRSRLLAASELYVGQKISIVYDPRDISTLKAYSML